LIDVIPAVPSSNVDVTVALAARVRLHIPLPVHAPDHPSKVVPELGVAVNTTAVPLGKLAVQVPGQLIPAGELETVPPPVPALATVTWILPPPDPDPDPTVIVTDAEVVPPAPVAVAVYVVVEVGATDTVPPVAPNVRLLPLLPLSVTCVAFVADTVTTEELPVAIVVGLAVMVAVGVPDEPPLPPVVTVIITLAEAVPPAPVAVAVYVAVEVGLTDTAPPPAAIVRELPLVPVIVIPVAFWAITVKTEELPLVIDVGLALSVTVGAGELAATAWLLRNAGTAHGRSIERT